ASWRRSRLPRPTGARFLRPEHRRHTGARLAAGAAPCFRPFVPDLPFRVARQSSSREVEESTVESRKRAAGRVPAFGFQFFACRLSTGYWAFSFRLSTFDFSIAQSLILSAFVCP